MGLAQQLRESMGDLTEREVIGMTFQAIDAELHNVKLHVDRARKANDRMKARDPSMPKTHAEYLPKAIQRDLSTAETHAEYLLKTIRKVAKSV